jgi:manganese/zinc/iron transport system substrate-binding protein
MTNFKMHLSRFLLLLLCGMAAWLVVNCRPGNSNPKGDPTAGKKLKVVATTGMVADLVTMITGDLVELKTLMTTGVDPHSYKPTPEDVQTLQQADVIVINGLSLEGKMTDTFQKMKKAGKKVFSVGDYLKREELLSDFSSNAGLSDPHIWGDLKLWSKAIGGLEKDFTEVMPNNVEAVRSQGVAARTALSEADRYLRELAKQLDFKQRVLVTSHDAFRYFGRAYEFEVIGVQGISTDSEAGLADTARVVDLVKARGVKAIFVETSVQPALIERISKDSGAKIGGELFSDALGTPGDMVEMPNGKKYDKGTVIGMIMSNMRQIVSALK